MKYHFVYLTTCLTTGLKYIGKHSTSNINDGYLGSGCLIRKHIKKYGKKHFSRQVLGWFSSSDDAYRAEAILLAQVEANSNAEYLNKSIGGPITLAKFAIPPKCDTAPEVVDTSEDFIEIEEEDEDPALKARIIKEVGELLLKWRVPIYIVKKVKDKINLL